MAKVNKFQLIQAKAEILSNIYTNLELELNSSKVHYGKTGRVVQSKHYDSSIHDYVLEWEDEDETIPTMADEWDDIPYTDEELELDPNRVAKIKALEEIMKAVERMI